MIFLEAAWQAILRSSRDGSGESVDIVNAMPKLQAAFSGDFPVRVNRTKPEHAALCG
jgi:hypothetical protein